MLPEVVTVSKEEGEVETILYRDFIPIFRRGYLRVGPERVLFTDNYVNFAEAIMNFEVRDDDVWVISFPKTGTTWTQEMVWCIANDLDFDRAKTNLSERFPFFEVSTCGHFGELAGPPLPPTVTNSVKFVEEMPSPRFIKSHLLWSLLPRQIQDGTKKPKIIYVSRDVKDTCLSYYHHAQILEGYTGTFDDFCTLFLADSVLFAPFWSHVLSAWDQRHKDNVLFLTYEQMKEDLPAVIRQTAEFLEKPLSEDQVKTLADHLSFESMKNNPSVNMEDFVKISELTMGIKEKGDFLRSGVTGGGKKKMSTEMRERFDRWTKERLQGTDYTE